MQRKTQGVSLQEILDHVFADQATQGGKACASVSGLGVAVPATRTSEDRSRIRQRVLEELARRKQARGEAPAASAESKSVGQPCAGPTQTHLFAVDETPEPEGASAPHFARLASQPRASRKVQSDVRDLVEKCYRSLLRPWPEEHVVLNPIANAEFIVRCRELGATVSETVLNRTLLNNRKAGRHSDVLRTHGCHLEAGTFERIGHAVEIAASLVQREWAAVGRAIPSVDDILCDPEQRRALSVYVNTLHDRVDAIDCHLVLLAFRKSGREASARAAGLSMPERTLFAPLRSVDPDDVSEGGGIYRVLCRRRPVFVSWTSSLRARVSEHLQRGGPEFLPAGLPFQIAGPLSIEVFSLPQSAPRSDFDALTRRLRLQPAEDRVPAPPDLNWRESGTLFSSHESVVRREALAC
jgi:hypothetical protein